MSRKPSKLWGSFSISTPISFCRNVIIFMPPLWEMELHNDTLQISSCDRNHTIQDKTVSLGPTGTAGEMAANSWRRHFNFHTQQSSSPGPIIKAPPCWTGSPWKSKAGPVIALHILLMLPRNAFDFTWGLRTKQNHKTFAI